MPITVKTKVRAAALGLCLAAALGARGQPAPDYRGDPVPAEVDRMYTSGLAFLLRSQTPAGNWPGQYGDQPAVVGLAVLAMLAQGDDPNTGNCARAIRRGLEYIFANTDNETGYIGTSMYNHAFATLALAEAYGSVDDRRLGPVLQKAVALILAAQDNNPQGAWRYRPDSHDADTTVSGAQMVALYAARNAGLTVPDRALQSGLDFFARCQHVSGAFGYMTPETGRRPTSAIGALVLALARRQDSCRAAVQALEKMGFDESLYAYYYLYYASQAFFHDPAGSWKKWNAENIRRLAARQNSDGSWSDSGGGTALPTAGALLSLALNYRYLPIYER